jgi:ferredoxin
MSPFGIRNKLKSLLGASGASNKAAPVREQRPRFAVTFVLPDGSEYNADASQHDSLVMTSNRGPKPIATGCADGTCATCRCEVLAGGDMLSPPDDHETKTKRINNVDAALRLGCQTAVLGHGVKVRVVNVLGEPG